MLWVHIILAALYSAALLRMFLSDVSHPSLLATTPAWLSISLPAVVWGSVFLVLNRRALDRLDTRLVLKHGVADQVATGCHNKDPA